jgi:hypothetical protein
MQAPAKRTKPATAAGNGCPTDDELEAIRTALAGMRYGTVQVIVQDGVIVQIDRTEKRRLRVGGEQAGRDGHGAK